MQSDSVAIPLNGIDAPPPLIDLDKIGQIVATTYDYISSIYSQKHYDDFVLRDPLETFDRLLKTHNKRSILDIGCGPGWESTFLIPRSFDVVGIDASERMIEMARKNVPYGKFLQMKMHRLEFHEATFDAIWSARTLIHVPQELLVDLLAAWKRVLKPGGIIGVSVIVGNRNGWEPEEYAPQWPMFNRFFAEGEIEKALETAGYSILNKKVVEDSRDPENPQNHFIFAQKPDTHLDMQSYHKYVTYSPDEKRWIFNEDYLDEVISQFLQAGTLQTKEHVNFCVLYDQLATRDRGDSYKHKLAAWKLKLHLQTPNTLSCRNFDVWYTYGRLHLKLTQFEEAVLCLEMARKLKPNDFATLVRLGYSYEGLTRFDEAIEVAQKAKTLAETGEVQISEAERADLFHALGHFYVSRSHIKKGEQSISDRMEGEKFMQMACNTEDGYAYLSCLGSIYNETKRYKETLRLLDGAISEKKVRENIPLYNELHFYRGEACMCLGAEYYDEAMANFNQVEQYARSRQDWDALAHVKLYQVRTSLRRNKVSELTLEQIKEYLSTIYEYEPSLYVVESFQRDRERLISILSTFYRLKQCLDEKVENFNQKLDEAIAYMEKIADDAEAQDLRLLVLSDNLKAAHHYMSKFAFPPQFLRFSEAEIEFSEQKFEQFRVWGVLVESNEIVSSTLSNISFLIGKAFQEGKTIYVYDPLRVFPESMRVTLQAFFVDSIEDVRQLCYVMVLYDKAREYLNSTKTPLGMAPIGVAPSLLASQAENIDLLSLAKADVNG